MRGKIRAATKFNRMKEHLSSLEFDPVVGDFVDYITRDPMGTSTFHSSIKEYCDESETLDFDKEGNINSLYHVLRIANRAVLLRDLENFAELTWGKTLGKFRLYTALSVLYSINLIDYTKREFYDFSSNTLQFFTKNE